MDLFRTSQQGGDPLPTQRPPEPHPKEEEQPADRSAHTSKHEGHLSGTQPRHHERGGDQLDLRKRKDLQSQRAPARIKSGGAPHGRGSRNNYNHKHRGQMGGNNAVSEFSQEQQREQPEGLQGALDPPEQGRTQECREGPGTRQQQTQQAEQRDELQRPRREQKRWTRGRGLQPQHNYQWRPVVRGDKEENAQQQQPQHSQQELEQSVSQKQLQTHKEHVPEQPTRPQQQQRQRTYTRGTQRRYPQGRHVQRQQCDEIHNEQRSNSQQSQLPGVQLQQQQQPVTCRRACVRPQPAGVASSVAMELQRVRRQFFDSFALLFCHPRLMTLLENQPSADREWKIPPARNSSLATRDSKVPPAIGDASDQRKNADNADDFSVGAPVVPKPSNDVPYTDDSSCEKLPAGGHQRGSSTPLCVFEVILNPTDPEFDKSLLPCGLRLQVTVEKNYPGSEAITTSQQDGDIPSRGEKVNGGVNGRDNATVVAARVATASSDSANYVGGDSHPPPATTHSCGPVDTHSCEFASSVASLYVCNEELNDFRRNAIEMVFSKVIEQQLARGEKADLVRTAIKAVDRHLRDVFALQVPHTESASQKVEMPWTEEEQRKLEEAVVLYRRVAEPVLRWRNISSHVGTRTAKECAMRFQICRSAVLNERQKVLEGANTKEESEESSDGLEDELDGEDGENNAGVPGRTPAVARGSDVSLIDTTSEGVSSLHLSCIRLQVTCGRCKSPADMRVSLPKDGAALDAAGCSVTCAKCQLRMGIKVQPLIGVTGSSLMRVAVVEEIDCHLKDLMPCDFVLTCDCCGASMKARELQSGSPRTNHCRHCHSKMAFGFQGAALGHAVVCGLGAEGSKSRPTPSFHQRQRKQDLRIVVGTPLADHGTCKHYKKSFRWLRFPCCGKAYPCDICHDSNEDHEHEWATRMICGFCSVEQAFSNVKPCSCGKALTKGRASAHWEGGKGCRDKTRMSRKDSRKYKGVSK